MGMWIADQKGNLNIFANTPASLTEQVHAVQWRLLTQKENTTRVFRRTTRAASDRNRPEERRRQEDLSETALENERNPTSPRRETAI